VSPERTVSLGSKTLRPLDCRSGQTFSLASDLSSTRRTIDLSGDRIALNGGRFASSPEWVKRSTAARPAEQAAPTPVRHRPADRCAGASAPGAAPGPGQARSQRSLHVDVV